MFAVCFLSVSGGRHVSFFLVKVFVVGLFIDSRSGGLYHGSQG